MRAILAAAACAALSLMAGTQPSRAEVAYPWCANYAGEGWSNCGFVSLAQCHAALSGNGGWCTANPMFRGPEAFARAHPRR